MEQIIVAILVMIFSGIIAAAKERAKKKNNIPVVPDFLSSTETRATPPPPARIDIPEVPAPAQKATTAVLPEEGVRVTRDYAAPSEADIAEQQRQEAAAANRERWRRAIIDSEIITPKF